MTVYIVLSYLLMFIFLSTDKHDDIPEVLIGTVWVLSPITLPVYLILLGLRAIGHFFLHGI